ncbi:MBL fold metallo-hydrolase [Streptomyces tuirus]|uniref:MBL fold metallo-hydrolase n=1 Tax=Streptomyces tuirus TaxID=68278 RepID=A0A941J1P8_9ACTN|nr:MBL fold metallo-hydrolase [Streptomyces tuirus]
MTDRASISERLGRPGQLRSLHLGETTVTYVPDGAARLSPRGWLPVTTDDDWAEHSRFLDESGQLVDSIGGLLVERGGRALLIDAGLGQASSPAWGGPIGAVDSGGLLDRLADVGRDPGTVETVAFTHLHPDHVGWAWRAAPDRDDAAFTTAEYRISAAEWEHRELMTGHGTPKDVLEKLEPRLRTLADGEEIFPGVVARVIGGHTAGHTAYVISDGGRRIIAFGDAFHTPAQISKPHWCAANDHDPEAGAQERRRLIQELTQPDTVGFGGHFADVVFGRVEMRGGEPVWQPVENVDRL